MILMMVPWWTLSIQYVHRLKDNNADVLLGIKSVQVQRDHEEEVRGWGSLGRSNQRLMYEIGSLTVRPVVCNENNWSKKRLRGVHLRPAG